MGDTLLAVLVFCSIAVMTIVIVRAFDQALRQSRATPKGPTASEHELASVRKDIADLRGTLRGDVAEFERRMAEREK